MIQSMKATHKVRKFRMSQTDGTRSRRKRELSNTRRTQRKIKYA